MSGTKYLAATRAWSLCVWKGVARYYTVRAGGQVNKKATWYYPHPSPPARKIKNHAAFWHGVQVDPGPTSPVPAVPQTQAAPRPEAGPAPGGPAG
jgi:uncharacterized protein (DUF427 family)